MKTEHETSCSKVYHGYAHVVYSYSHHICVIFHIYLPRYVAMIDDLVIWFAIAKLLSDNESTVSPCFISYSNWFFNEQ